jgi:hypothetical protein
MFLFAIVLSFSSCKEKKVDPVEKDPEVILSANGWQLTRFTDLSGKTLNNASLNGSALTLTQMIFEFRANYETRAIDKISKNIINRGTWALLENDTVLDINIIGFKGKFKVIILEKGKLTLQASTGNFLSGVGSELNMEFEESAI